MSKIFKKHNPLDNPRVTVDFPGDVLNAINRIAKRRNLSQRGAIRTMVINTLIAEGLITEDRDEGRDAGQIREG